MDHLALIGREAKQPCLYRFAQQPLSCLVHPLFGGQIKRDWSSTGRMAPGKARRHDWDVRESIHAKFF